MNVRSMTDASPRSWRSVVPLLALLTVVVAGCSEVGTSTLTFWDLIWSMVAFFFWFAFIWIFISLFADIIRRDDLSGPSKALWILLLVVLPFIGALIYIATRPKVTPQDVRLMAQTEAATKAAASVSTADEIEKLQQLRATGAISEPEYEVLKQRALAH